MKKRKYNRLSERDVKNIRTMWCNGSMTQAEIAIVYDTCQSNISYIVNRITHG